MRLVNNAKGFFFKYTSKTTYITHNVFGKDCAAIDEIKPVLIIKKTIYVGFAVLDLSNGRCMTSITILLKRILVLSCYLLTQTVLLMK